MPPEVAQVLKGLGFQVQDLYDKDATKRNILEQSFAALAKTVAADDRVLVYFAGHGHTTTDAWGDNGFIVPWGGTLDPDFISMDELRVASATPNLARHQLFIMDSCYSGILTQGVSSSQRC